MNVPAPTWITDAHSSPSARLPAAGIVHALTRVSSAKNPIAMKPGRSRLGRRCCASFVYQSGTSAIRATSAMPTVYSTETMILNLLSSGSRGQHVVCVCVALDCGVSCRRSPSVAAAAALSVLSQPEAHTYLIAHAPINRKRVQDYGCGYIKTAHEYHE